MKVLVTYASKHESTQQIAERIAAALRHHDLDAVALPVKQVDNVAGYDAFVVGSGVYFGSWMHEAVEFVQLHATTLALHPVWLFSSGPTGPHKPQSETEATPRQIAQFEQTLHQRGHKVFFGALDPTRLSFLERTVVRGVKAPTGDFRDWDEIEAWALSIATALQPAATRS